MRATTSRKHAGTCLPGLRTVLIPSLSNRLQHIFHVLLNKSSGVKIRESSQGKSLGEPDDSRRPSGRLRADVVRISDCIGSAVRGEQSGQLMYNTLYGSALSELIKLCRHVVYGLLRFRANVQVSAGIGNIIQVAAFSSELPVSSLSPFGYKRSDSRITASVESVSNVASCISYGLRQLKTRRS